MLATTAGSAAVEFASSRLGVRRRADLAQVRAPRWSGNRNALPKEWSQGHGRADCRTRGQAREGRGSCERPGAAEPLCRAPSMPEGVTVDEYRRARLPRTKPLTAVLYGRVCRVRGRRRRLDL